MPSQLLLAITLKRLICYACANIYVNLWWNMLIRVVKQAPCVSRLVILVAVANDSLVFADSAASVAAVSVVPLKTVDWHCETRLFDVSRMSSIVGLMRRPVAESHCRHGVASASLLGRYLPHKRADAWRFHAATSQPESLATKQICSTPPDSGLSRLSDQGGMVTVLGGLQTKPILRMCHCRPAHYILHCYARC